MSMLELGRLEEVNVRELWSHEQYDFSNWLAKEENIDLLNEVLGLTLVDIEKEVFVGAYRCDLVAKDEASRLVFWTRFNEVVVERGKPFNLRKTTTDHWYDVAIGVSGVLVEITLVNKEGCVGIALYIIDDKELFDSLNEKKIEIESKLGFELDWQRLDNKKASRIIYRIPGLNFDDHSNYDALMNDIIDKVILFVKVFKKYVK